MEYRKSSFLTLYCDNFISHNYVDPPVGWGSTYCFSAVGVGVGVTPITKAPPCSNFFGCHVFYSPGH